MAILMAKSLHQLKIQSFYMLRVHEAVGSTPATPTKASNRWKPCIIKAFSGVCFASLALRETQKTANKCKQKHYFDGKIDGKL